MGILGSIASGVEGAAKITGGAISGNPALIASGAANVAGAVTSAFSGSSTTSGFTLPPAYEIQLINYFDSQQKAIAGQQTNMAGIMKGFQDKMSALDGILNGSLPSAAGMKQLTDANMSLASHLQMSGEDLVANGFMSKDDVSTLQQLRDLNSAPQVTDPQLQQQLSDQRARLNQDLMRQGASPAIRAQALAQFDRDATAQTFQRSQELKTSQAGLLTNTLQASINARTAGFNQAVGALNAGQGQVVAGTNQVGASSTLANTKLSGTISGQQEETALSQAGQEEFNQLGKYKLSQYTSRLTNAGVVGAAGSTFSQTGVAQGEDERLGNVYNTATRAANDAGNFETGGQNISAAGAFAAYVGKQRSALGA